MNGYASALRRERMVNGTRGRGCKSRFHPYTNGYEANAVVLTYTRLPGPASWFANRAAFVSTDTLVRCGVRGESPRSRQLFRSIRA